MSTTLPNRAHQSLSRTWIETVSGSPTTPWIHDLDLSEHALTCQACQVQQGLSKLHALVHLRKGATENRDEACLPSRIRKREPHSASQNAYAGKSKNWMRDSGARVTRPTCEDTAALVCLQLLLLPFHPLIHSGRISWMISFTFLVPATSLSSSYAVSWHILVAARTGPVHTTPAMHHVPPTSGLAAFPLRPLPPQATVYRHRILQAIEHPDRMYAPSRRWPGSNSVGSATPTP